MAAITREQIRDNSRELVQLVSLAQAGDREAFGELFERYQQHVFATALRRLGNYCEAQELCQEVFVQAMVKIGQLREPRSFGGWLRSITTRMAINRVSRRAPAVATEPRALEASCSTSRTPLCQALENERDSQLHAGLGRLRELDRATLVAFYVHGQSLIEMSEDFAAPVGTIKRRLHVARKRLSKEVEELQPA